MTSVEIASAYVNLIAKMPGVKSEIASALGASDVSRTVERQGSSWGNVLTGAVAGAAAAAVSKAITLVTGSIDSAIKRVDTMNNFPKIMANLGYAAGDAQKSIDTMSKSLMGLPTSLNTMAGVVQQLAPLTNGLDEATGLSLALNNALLAGGKSTDIQANAMDQYVQMLAVGKVDMAAWRSIVTAMPGQMDQLSKSLLGAGAKQTDLYAAMQDGTISFGQFNDAILQLNDTGLAGFASFEDQARSATDGIGTAQENLNTAITRGMAKIIDKFAPQITGALKSVGEAATNMFNGLVSAVDWAEQNKDWLVPLTVGVGAFTGAIGALVLAQKAWAVAQGIATFAVAAYTVAMNGGVGATFLFNTATKSGAAAQWLLNAAMNANPIMLIVTAIAALVAGLVYFFTQTELGKQVWENVTNAIGTAVTWLWESIIRPAVDWIVGAWTWMTDAIGTASTWLWESVLNPVFTAISDIFNWIWANAIKPVVDTIVNAFRFWGAVANWLYVNVLQPVFQQIGAIFRWISDNIVTPVVNQIQANIQALGVVFGWLYANVIKPVFDQIGAIFTWINQNIVTPIINQIQTNLQTLGAIFTWLYENAIKPAWEGIGNALRVTWDWIDKNVFTPFKTGIDLIAKGFEVAKSAIATTWEGIKVAAATPINFVLDVVWNKGLRSFWNDVVGNLGLNDMKLPAAKLVKFASGGVLPGYTPGRDVHMFTSPTGGRLALSGGEAIMRPEFTRAVGGKAGVDRLNAMARSGGLAFKDGGVFDFVGDVWDNVTNAASVAFEFFTNPAQAIQKHVVDGILKPLLASADQNVFLRAVGDLPRKLVTGLVGNFEKAAPKGAGTAGMGWQAMWKMVQAGAPGLSKTSDYRPGAVTVNGGQSYHALGRAIDLIPATMDTFNKVAAMFPNASELIYSPAGDRQLQNGKPFNGWSSAVRAQHWDHIHLAMANGGVVPKLYDQGGWLPDGGLAVNRSGQPEAVLDPAESAALKNGLMGGRSLRLVVGGREFDAYLEEVADGRISVYDSASSRRIGQGVRAGW